MNIAEIAQNSASIYFDYATKNHTAVIRYTITKITHAGLIYEFKLANRIRAAEDLSLEVNHVVYNEDQAKIIDYDSENAVIRVLLHNEYASILENIDAKDVAFIYDLRFLIKRVSNWYSKYGHLISLPQNAPSISRYHPRNSPIKPSLDQVKAVNGILSQPLSYVWGAPGTGKTQVVLSLAIMNYVKRKQRILITAPTNRAVEQILNGILPRLKDFGIKDDAFIRLGVPTKEFALAHPTICETHKLITALTEAKQRIEFLESQIAQLDQQIKKIRKFSTYIEYRERFKTAEIALPKLLNKLKETQQILFHLKKGEISLLKELEIANSSKKTITTEIEQQTNMQITLNSKLKNYQSSFLRFLLSKKIEYCILKISHTEEKIRLLLEKELCLEETIVKKEEKLNEISNQQENNSALKEEYIQKIHEYSQILLELKVLKKTLPLYDLTKAGQILIEASKDAAHLFAEKEKEYNDVNQFDLQEFLSLRLRYQQELKELKEKFSDLEKNKKVRLSNCLVVATTIDHCLTQILPNSDLAPSHVFIDEAGYAPLIKAAALTAYQCPITMLGDHMQLPPICEIDDDKLNTESLSPAVLWAQSALFIEDFISNGLDYVFKKYFKNDPPDFKFLKKYDLLYSFRFGENLASVLAGEVYSENLRGTSNHQTKIHFINAKKFKKINPNAQSIKRYSEAECIAIKDFVKKFDHLKIGVITPYSNQKNALRKILPDFIDVNTVHGSQGLEWECVVFSVVDTTDMWFTNTLLKESNGKNIINTAVSRAINHLVIVCDVDFWSKQEKQLIGKLLKIATELKT